MQSDRQCVLFIASRNTAAVTESSGRCGLSMRQICRPPGNDKGNFGALSVYGLEGLQSRYLLVSVTYGTLAPSPSFVCTQHSSFIRIGKQTTFIRRGGICGQNCGNGLSSWLKTGKLWCTDRMECVKRRDGLTNT